MNAALAGIKVLELSRVLAGPWAGMTLGDLGADVIKLEPLAGDDTRGYGPPFKDGMSAYFACCNRNKRSIAVDLAAPGAPALVAKLARWADVVVQNFRTGTDVALGVDYRTLARENPRLVYCSISGYGRTGPGATRPGYDFVVQAEAGLMSITGPVDGEPSKAGVAVADITTGMNAVIAILAALRARDATGAGQHIDVSLFDTQLQWLANVASGVLFTGDDAARYGNGHPSIVPYQAFHTADGGIAVAVASPKLWALFCAVVDRTGWIADPRFVDNAARVRNREALIGELETIFRQRPARDWLDALGSAGIPCAPINGVRAALADDVTTARGMRIELGGFPLVGSPLNLSSTPVRYDLPPPRLGEHTDAILAELGEDAAAARAAGLVA